LPAGPLPALAATVLIPAAQGAFPGPGPWGAREWSGAALYLLLFLAGLWGAWRLAAGVPGELPDSRGEFGPGAPAPEEPR